ncbi:LacI family DNA-binding transcriptional regulator [Actinokineospora auranticolor]|uniref:LacI family transcriptional regulator n=1 Tax=Actinokineospora auranticolor TaxID=155976 RepID=A0A2S6GTK2_9PSEU|nr:LacI family DNA-binding transcriptional regulator [Actinokineospora auranticolor]PPK68540.1 LacI family transcriptional regulator [Actinokineospora auranticolor]
MGGKRSARKPTLLDVGRLAGTSTAVVSYVLNGGPRPVSEKTRVKVEEAIQMLGYRRNPLAGALSGGRSNLIGLLVPDTANAFYGELSRCIEAEGRGRGLLTLLGNTGYGSSLGDEYGEAFSELRPRGIFVTTGEAPRGDDETPRVFLQWAVPGAGSPNVTFNDHEGARLVVEHLVEHGYTDIACLAGEIEVGPAVGREGGWRRAMADAGLPTAGRLVRSSFDRVAAEQAVKRVLRGRDRPRAIYATTDEQALITIRTATNLGLRVPEDLAVVGFDGIREAVLGGFPLTTVRLPLETFAARAFDALDRVHAGDAPRDAILDGTLSVGVTCGCEPRT